MERQISEERYFGLGRVPIGIGSVLNGWHGGPNSVLDFRAMTERCLHDCFHCFTNKRKKTLTLDEIFASLDQAPDLGFKGVNFLGEGEPTLDLDFFPIIKYTSKKGLVPIIFTDVATELRDLDFIKKLYDTGASVCPKCDSLVNPDYQNWVVGDKSGEYFDKRDEAVLALKKAGFREARKDGTTRLGYDMVVTKRNIDEVTRTLRHCRDNNLWVVFSTPLPAGRSGSETFDRSLNPSREELSTMRSKIQKIDAEYGFNHPIYNNFATFPCVEFMQIYGNGDVSPCPGNETFVGNIKTDSLKVLAGRIRKMFPCHKEENCTGYCTYRS